MPFQNPTDLAQIDSNGLGITLSNGTDEAGYSVAVGDVNGDGKADMLLGGWGNQAYLIFGRSNPVPVDLGTMALSTGVLLSGGSGLAGISVAIGDVNGDGKGDMLLGAYNNNQTYLVFGSSSPSAVDLGAMPANTGVLLSGGSGEAGRSVAIGDVNGDGKADMLIGALSGNQVYLVFGSSNPINVDLGTMPESIGVVLNSDNGYVGLALAMGDVNGDGKADMLIGAPDSNQAYLVFGSSNPSAVGLDTMPASIGILLNGGSDRAGRSVAMGDVNGDGKADMLIGAYENNQVYLIFGSSSPSPVNLGTMPALTGVLLSGGSDEAGYSVAIGDVNNDGKADMLIGAYNGIQTYLVFGSSNPINIDLGTMPANTGILLSNGIGNAGWSVAMGDVNGDGKADMLIGAYENNQTYLIYGGPPPEPVTSCLALANLNGLGSGSLTFAGTQLSSGNGTKEFTVAIGDINGDNKADMLIGTPTRNQVYLVFGSTNPVSMDLDIMPASIGVLLNGGSYNAGYSVAVGDVNRDGKADMLIGAPTSNQVYLVFGSSSPSTVDLSTMPANTGILLSNGIGNAGQSVAMGDVNGDGKADMLIGAPTSNQVYLVFGSSSPSAVDLGKMPATTGILLSNGTDNAGQSVAVGDVNGDGKADMLIGAPGEIGKNGQVYLVFGSSNPIAIDLGNLLPSTGVLLSGGNGKPGYSVAIGDVNGDGKADMLLGVPFSNQAYMVFGSSNPVSVDLEAMSPSTGVLLNSGSGDAGQSVAIGDINGDGYGDMLIGAFDNQAYLVFGSSNPGSVDLSTMSANIGVLLSGGSGGAGQSVAIGDVNGDGLGDMLVGAQDGNQVYMILGNHTPWLSSAQSNVTYTPGNPPVAINLQLALDENSPIIIVSIQISENYKQGDYLEIFPNQLPINITAEPFNIETGTLTLTGIAPAYLYQQALESVYYFSNATTIDPLPRTITFQANDGMICGISNQFNHTIYINATAMPTPTSNFNPSQLAMLIAFPIGGFFLLTLVLGLFGYRRYQALHEFDEDDSDDVEAQPLIPLLDLAEHEQHDNLVIETVVTETTAERLYQQALRSQNSEDKRRYLEQAIAQGHIASNFELAQLYERGVLDEAMPETLKTACAYYIEAEAQGYTEATYQLPRIYHKLTLAYHATDVNQALQYYQKAIAAGYFAAQESLAQWVAEGLQLEQSTLQAQLASHIYGVQAKQADEAKQKKAAIELLDKAQQTDAYGRSLLHLAVLYSCNHCIKTLLKNGTSVTQKDATGKTPLDLAKQQSTYQIIDLLQEEQLFEQNNAKNEARFQQLLEQLQVSLPEEEEADAENQEELLQAQAQALKHSLLDITELEPLLSSREALREEVQRLDDYREKAQKDTLIDLIKRLKTPAQLLSKHSKGHEANSTRPIKKTGKHLAFLGKRIEAAKRHFTSEDKRLIATLLDNIHAYYQEYSYQIQAKRSVAEQRALFNPKAVIHAAGEAFRFRHLKQEAQQKLISQTGERDNQHGIHEVKEYNGVHYKLQPYAPGVEYMVNSLAEIVAGHGTSPTALLNISYDDNFIYQASKTVVGVNLEHIVLCHPELINKIDARNFSEMCLLSVLIDPQDGKADNYMVRIQVNTDRKVESLRIVGIDNDIAFADPIIKQHRGEHQGKHYINVKNILYFFPQMDSVIHPEFKHYFLSHSPEVIVIQWLEALAKKNEEYQALLEEQVLTEEQLTGLQLPIKLVPNLALKLRNKIQAMQEIMRQQPALTHRELLEHIEPILQRYYQEVQKKEPNPWRATLKLYKASVNSVEDSLRLETRITSRHRLLTELAYHQSEEDAFQDNRTQTLQEAMEEFITAINLPAIDNPEQKSAAVYIGKPYLIEHLKLMNDSLLTRISLPELVQRYPNIKVLTLLNCQQVLANDVLLTLLEYPSLTLRLGSCNKISNANDWQRIYQRCKHFILIVGNIELNISEEEPDEMLKRCEEADVATDAIRQFMRLLSKQEKKGAHATGSSSLRRNSIQPAPRTLFFSSPKQTGNSFSRSSSLSRSANNDDH